MYKLSFITRFAQTQTSEYRRLINFINDAYSAIRRFLFDDGNIRRTKQRLPQWRNGDPSPWN